LWEEQIFNVGVSIGLVSITEDTQDLTEILKNADTACYVAKEKGRNRIHTHIPKDLEVARHHGEMQWVINLNKAIDQALFLLYGQMIEPLDCSIERHCEILIRMKDKNGKIILPGKFLPA
ncbi:MAG: diguanylate cyclase, partial [Candidatus Dadabacteria bacterium]|nr:diguanylate cyclase [Candidatus Dadabacteria bacterium]